MRTWSGVHAPLTKGEGDVNILDLVVHLGRTARFGGVGDPEWTVLHHSMLCTLIAYRLGWQDVAGYALLHDAHEAYIGDIPTPVKDAIGRDAVRTVERAVDSRINDHLGLTAPDAAIRKRIRQCDQIALLIESVLFGPLDCDLLDTVPPDERAAAVALCEKVLPGFQAIARRKSK